MMRGTSVRSATFLNIFGGACAAVLLLAAVSPLPAAVQPSAEWRIDTFAGLPKLGDNGPGNEARLDFPSGVAVDGAGNLYIADSENHRIRKVDATGTITTVAGSGEPGYSGDGGPATEAQLTWPSGVAVDGAGNLYIADSENHRIRKVDATGTITTVAGSGEPGYSGDGGPATEAQLTWPSGVAVDGAGNLYIADRGNHRIRILTLLARLDFAHFANGTGITSEMVFVNVAPHPIRPGLYFYDKRGNPIAAESVVDMMEDLVVQEDGGVTVQTAVASLGELTISTHGRGEVGSGSVRVVSGGPIGGVLRFDLPGIGVAGVGASPPVRDAIFPARSQAGGIRTAAALRNLSESELMLTCRLMMGGEVMEEQDLTLPANGQDALFVNELFESDTSDFTGSVRCTAPPGEQEFTGVAVELDAANRIFTTLPVVPVPERISQE